MHPSCTYTHNLILNSLPLGAVQMKYGGILARHSNLLMLQEGEPGDGKSVALWLDVQVLSHYDQKREERTKAAYEKLLAQHRAGPEHAHTGASEGRGEGV